MICFPAHKTKIGKSAAVNVRTMVLTKPLGAALQISFNVFGVCAKLLATLNESDFLEYGHELLILGKGQNDGSRYSFEHFSGLSSKSNSHA